MSSLALAKFCATMGEMRNVIATVLRLVLTSLGLWIGVRLFGHETGNTETLVAVYLLAGLVFTFVNAAIRPIVTVLSLPFVFVTLGLFTLVINGFLVWLTLLCVPFISVNFGGAILTGLVLSLVNYVISYVDEEIERGGKHE